MLRLGFEMSRRFYYKIARTVLVITELIIIKRLLCNELKIVANPNIRSHMTAAGLGFEPRYTVPETVVLPLDDPAKAYINKHIVP